MKERDQESRGTASAVATSKSARYLPGPSRFHYEGNSLAIDLSDDAMAIVNDLIDRTQESPSELFIKALVLYKVAMDAKAEGNHLAIVNADGELVQDIIGL
jgi:hypothetical protein